MAGNPEQGDTVHMMIPGAISAKDVAAVNTSALFFPKGIYWIQDPGMSHIILNPATSWVHFEAGAYVKAAIEYTTDVIDFRATGFGVLSGENYVYQANPSKCGWAYSRYGCYQGEKSDGDSLRMWWHRGYTAVRQTWTAVGVTIANPPFNSM